MTNCSVQHTLSPPRRDGKRKPGWKVAWRDDAGKQRSRAFDTEDGAERWAALVRAIGATAALKRLHEDSDRVSVVTLSEALDTHLSELVVKPGTLVEYRRLAARTWLDSLGPIPVHALTKQMVVRWVEAERQRLAPKTIANAHGLLSAVMATAVDQGHATGNPCRGVKMPTGEKDDKPWLTEDELIRVIAATDEWHRPFVTLLGMTGLRFGEATALQWRDLDLDRDRPQMRVQRTWHKIEHGWELGAPKTKKSRRTLPLADEVVDALLEVRDRGAVKPTGLVFLGQQGGARIWPSRFTEHVLRPALVKAKITTNVTPHSFRDSYASHLVARGIALPVVQYLMGHESITTTVDKYVHVSMTNVLEAVTGRQADRAALER